MFVDHTSYSNLYAGSGVLGYICPGRLPIKTGQALMQRDGRRKSLRVLLFFFLLLSLIPIELGIYIFGPPHWIRNCRPLRGIQPGDENKSRKR